MNLISWNVWDVTNMQRYFTYMLSAIISYAWKFKTAYSYSFYIFFLEFKYLLMALDNHTCIPNAVYIESAQGVSKIQTVQ